MAALDKYSTLLVEFNQGFNYIKQSDSVGFESDGGNDEQGLSLSDEA